jgi:NAD(P)-dependent dehydrogenase (short-subunit alcohol dehydrogenase family)
MANAIVTGANRGIGLQLCGALKERGYSVTGLCRQPSDALADLGINVHENYDVTDGAAIDEFARTVEPGTVDLLINNAGILHGTTLDDLDLESVRRQFEVNALGPLRVTRSLLHALKDGAKIALVTSRMGSIADNDSGGSYGYRMSKAALNAAGMSLARDLHARGIAIAILHPGYVRTDMTGQSGLIDPDESVAGLLQRIDELNLNNTGTFWHTNGEILPW